MLKLGIHNFLLRRRSLYNHKLQAAIQNLLLILGSMSNNFSLLLTVYIIEKDTNKQRLHPQNILQYKLCEKSNAVQII